MELSGPGGGTSTDGRCFTHLYLQSALFLIEVINWEVGGS